MRGEDDGPYPRLLVLNLRDAVLFFIPLSLLIEEAHPPHTGDGGELFNQQGERYEED